MICGYAVGLGPAVHRLVAMFYHPAIADECNSLWDFILSASVVLIGEVIILRSRGAHKAKESGQGFKRA